MAFGSSIDNKPVKLATSQNERSKEIAYVGRKYSYRWIWWYIWL